MSAAPKAAGVAQPVIDVSAETPVKMPLRVFVALTGVVVAGAVVWGLTSNAVSNNTRRIETLESDQRTTREVLIRIDERTAEIKRQIERAR